MKAFVCEMCNSSDMVKQDGFVVCQHCGMKYTSEEVKKKMIEDNDTVVGTSSVDYTGSYDRILSLARDAFEDRNFEKAYEYYCQAVEIKPDDAESVMRQGLALLGKDGVQTDVPIACVNRASKAVELLKKMPNNDEKTKCASMLLEDIGAVCDLINSNLKKISHKLLDEYEIGRSSADKVADLSRHVVVAALNQAEDRRIARHNDAIHEEIKEVSRCISKLEDFKKEYSDKLAAFLNQDQFIKKGIEYLEKGVHQSAITCFEKYIQDKPKSVVGYLGNAAALLEAEKPQDAAEMLECAAAYRPTEAETAYIEKLINMRLGVSQTTLLIEAAAWSKYEAVKLLVDLGSDVNAKTKDQVTALWWGAKGKRFNQAATEADIKIAKLLLDKGASIDVVAVSGVYKGANLYNKYTDPQIKALIRAKYPDATMRNNPDSGGCYVATAVYGSYDCPQVWTLRRYRDNILAKTLLGRLFIRTYYTISPTLVKWFGNTNWFRKLWKVPLDRMVSKLQIQGVECTPYEDRNW